MQPLIDGEFMCANYMCQLRDRCVMYHFVANIDYRYLWIGPIAHEETVECGYFINKFYNIKMVRN